MIRFTRTFVLIALTLTLLFSQAAWAESDGTVTEIYDTLVAEDSYYSELKELYLSFNPDMRIDENLTDNGFTVSVTGSEGMDGSWDFEWDGDYLTATPSGDILYGLPVPRCVIGAIGEVYGMNDSLLNGYVSGVEMLNLDSHDFIIEPDETDGTVSRFQLYIAGPWEMAELGDMVIDERSLDFGPMQADEWRSIVANCGKLTVVANGNADNLTILLGEYGELDELAYRSVINAASILRPAGWEDFAANYTELADAETDAYTVMLNADEADVREIIDDPSENYSYAILRFGNAIYGGFYDAYEDMSDDWAGSGWTDIQYVMYLDTNGKDSNEPVFTRAEALEKAKEILIRHFGGYTIQEASGGWIDDGTEYQEYTLVIYLSDTTEDAVHAAADELIKVFDQSSILIQANPTRTEFYNGAA